MNKVDKLIEERKKLGRRAKNTTGYKGVTTDKRVNRTPYVAHFKLSYQEQKIQINLGSYETPEQAYLARIKFIDSLK